VAEESEENYKQNSATKKYFQFIIIYAKGVHIKGIWFGLNKISSSYNLVSNQIIFYYFLKKKKN